MAQCRAGRYSARMSQISRALRLVAPAALVAAAMPAFAAPSTSVIPLPLTPVVPAPERDCGAPGASGLGAVQLKPAEGAKPAKADYVLVNYVGYLAGNGQVFDQNMQSAFPVDGVIPGFGEGLQMMAKGSIWRFCVPSALGYGAQASGPIPANSDLVFQVELVDFKTLAEVQAMRAAQADNAAPASEAGEQAAEAAAKSAAKPAPQ